MAISRLTLSSWRVLLIQKKEKERALRFMLRVLHGEEVAFKKHYSKKNYTHAIKKPLKTFEARPKGIPRFLNLMFKYHYLELFLTLTRR